MSGSMSILLDCRIFVSMDGDFWTISLFVVSVKNWDRLTDFGLRSLIDVQRHTFIPEEGAGVHIAVCNSAM